MFRCMFAGRPGPASFHAMTDSPLSHRQVFTPAALNGVLRQMLDQQLPLLWIEGEISNFRPSNSPHWYFSLKDASAEIRCVMFRNRNQLVRMRPANGDRVLARARVTLYEPRGDLQLQVEHLEPQGLGALMRQLEETKARLAAEGLFDGARKRPLPRFPVRIAVVTSPQGAAWHDVRTVLERRWPMLAVDLVPSLVQGAEAPAQLVRALAFANRGDYDAILLTRGGGSIEDLFAFNDEGLARAIAASRLPVLAAIGHEVDVTIAEGVADLRAATPSAAAELLVPDQAEMAQRLDELAERIRLTADARLGNARLRLAALGEGLRAADPAQAVARWRARIDALGARLGGAAQAALGPGRKRLVAARDGLVAAQPAAQVQRLRATCDRWHDQMVSDIGRRVLSARGKVGALGGSLHALSPLATLERGYAIALAEGAVVTDATQVPEGALIDVRLAHGALRAKVTERH